MAWRARTVIPDRLATHIARPFRFTLSPSTTPAEDLARHLRIDRQKRFGIVTEMKTGPGLLSRSASSGVVLALTWLLVIFCGCSSSTARIKKAPYPAPPVVEAAKILRRDAITLRTRELLKAGKTRVEARRVAEDENPATSNPSHATPSPEYLRWKNQLAAQAKFEGELAKMNREP